MLSAFAPIVVAENTAEIPVVTVYGEKTTRSIYDTSASVNVFDADTIANTPNATEIADLMRLNPAIVDVGTGNHLPAIRGIDSSGPSIGGLATFAGISPRLNLSIDGRSLNYSEIAFGPRSLWDIEQAEIYVGPQSYVQGRNAIAGAIVMKSKDPTYHWESSVKGALGEHDYSQTAAMISAPIVEEQVAFRLAVDQQKRESHVDLATYEPVGNSGEIEMTTARAKLLIEPTAVPQLRTEFTISYMDTRSPQGEYELDPNGRPGAQMDEYRPIYTTDSLSTSWDLSWEFNDNVTFENNMTYSDLSFNRMTRPGPRLADFDADGDEYHLEPLIRYRSDDDRIQSLAGLRYYESEQDEAYLNAIGKHPMKDETETKSAFFEVTYAASPTIDITVAARYEREDRRRLVDASMKGRNGLLFINVDYDESFSAFLPKLDIAWKPEFGHTLGFKVGKGYNAGGAGISLIGFVPYKFEEETVLNYELYSRHRLDDGKLQLTSNIFYNDYDDMQLTQQLGPRDVIIRNAEKATTYGAEFGAQWMPSYHLEFFGNLALLRTEIKKFNDPDIEGNKFARAPEASATFGTRINFLDDFDFSANARYTSSYYSGHANNPEHKISGYWVANTQLAYQFDQGRAVLFVENVFDADDNTMIFNGSAATPLKVRPRTIGASVQLDF
nr:TonB-dependent receptor [Thaumasiovibrio subtropicus]